MRFYYGGWNSNHWFPVQGEAAIGVASVPLDRLFGVTTVGAGGALGGAAGAPRFFVVENEEAGAILTRPLLLNGNTLEVNAVVQGQMKVAVLDLDSKELPGFGLKDCQPIKGDSLRHRVSWSGGGSLNRDKQPVRLKFQLERATFYAFTLHGN